MLFRWPELVQSGEFWPRDVELIRAFFRCVGSKEPAD